MDRECENQLREIITGNLASLKKEPFIPGKTKIQLCAPSFGVEEVLEAMDSLLSTYVTMGAKVKRFERLFADYIGVKHAVMVNSGSSANLLALSVLSNPALANHLQPGDEIITPAVTWSTTVFPIINCQAVPVLVDVDLDTFTMNTMEIEKAIAPRTKAILPVHLLGNPCDMKRIRELADSHDLYIIEDTCEAHGSELNGQKTGSFSDMATFSFFFSHHMTTIEGGMVLTDNDEYAEMAKTLRVFGWIRDLENKEQLAELHKDIDSRFLFVNTGFNLRPTEIQGAFGIHQIERLEGFIDIRRQNADYWYSRLARHEDYLMAHREREGTRHVWLSYPITVQPGAPFSRRELMDYLETNGVETRTVMAGNIEEQPAMQYFHYRTSGDLTNSRYVMRNSFVIGNHQGIGPEEREAVADYIDEFIATKAGSRR